MMKQRMLRLLLTAICAVVLTGLAGCDAPAEDTGTVSDTHSVDDADIMAPDVTGTTNQDVKSDDASTPLDPCEECTSDESCWDDTCVETAWITLVTTNIPGTWEYPEKDEVGVVDLDAEDDYTLGDFPGLVRRIPSFHVKPDGTVDFVRESSGAHIIGSFYEEAGVLHFNYTYNKPNKPPAEFTIKRTSP